MTRGIGAVQAKYICHQTPGAKLRPELDGEMLATVMVVDDDPDDREITVLALRRSRVAVSCIQVSSGEAALAFLRTTEQLPALILMDLKMPGMSGIDTLRRIRADARLCGLPVVVVTNSTLQSDRAAALAAGADDFLQKCFDIRVYGNEIGARLERWVK